MESEIVLYNGIIIAMILLGVALVVHALVHGVDTWRYRSNQNRLSVMQQQVHDTLDHMMSMPRRRHNVHCPKCGRFAHLVSKMPTWNHVVCKEHGPLLAVHATAEILGLPVVTNQVVPIEIRAIRRTEVDTGVIELPVLTPRALTA